MMTAWRTSFLSLVGAVCLFSVACRGSETDPFLVLFCLDGADPEIMNRLRAEGKLPNIDRLIRSGAWSPMESVAAKRVLRPHPRLGLWSPIIWASVATGVVPEKHGILDFLLPMPGTAFSWIGNEHGSPRAEIILPEIHGRPPYTFRLRVRSYRPNDPQEIEILLNGHTMASVTVGETWEVVTTSVPEELLRPARNRLELLFSKQSRPSDRGASRDRRPLAGALASLEIEDAAGDRVVSMDPVSHRFAHGEGFYPPEAELVEAQSVHWKSRPVWRLLGDLGHPVGVVGYWSTWPAQEVGGFLVSSHMGLRGRRQQTRRQLTWPPELADELQPLQPTDAEIGEQVASLYPPACSPTHPRSLSVFEQVLWQDEFYFRIAQKLLPTLRRGFFTVYFESIDVGGHTFLPFLDGAELPPNCPDSLRDVVARIYQRNDAWIGELIENLPAAAVVMVVSDHGMVTAGDAGYHAPYGVFVASGPAIRRGISFHGASVLDVTPTLLELFDAAIPFQMDGKVLVQALQPEWLAEHPPRYAEAEAVVAEEQPNQPLTEDTEEIIDRLESIGYLQ